MHPFHLCRPFHLFMPDFSEAERLSRPGACVAVTMFHLTTRVAGICHAVLPTGEGALNPREGLNPEYRFVNSSIRAMFNYFEGCGIPRKQIRVKVFGGGDVLEVPKERTEPTVGKLNIEAAVQALDHYGIIPVVHEVGGIYGRKLFFITHTGDVYVKKIPRTALS